MHNDPIVDEIRQVRQKHSVTFQRDLHAICEDIRRQERESGRTFVTLPPRRVSTVVLSTGAAAVLNNAALQND